MNVDDIFKAHGIPVYYNFSPVDKCPLYVNGPLKLMLFRGKKESYTLKGDFLNAVSEYVGEDMYNEYVDIDNPLYHIVIKSDINTLIWEDFDGISSMQYNKYEIYQDGSKTQKIGTLAIFRGGLYKEDPYQWMSTCVDSYIKQNATTDSNTLNMIENTMDNPWVRVVLIMSKNIDSLLDNND